VPNQVKALKARNKLASANPIHSAPSELHSFFAHLPGPLAQAFAFRAFGASIAAREAAFLSAMIPNPRTVFNPQVNPKRVARRQRIIMRGMPSVKMPAGTG
jgi:hypothetical protein